MATIKDSGDRTEFSTGAVRDMHGEDKGRCDLLPLQVVSLLFPQDNIIHNLAEFQKNNDTDLLCETLSYFADYAYDGNKETMLLEVAKHYSDGCQKYGENNWQKGIPIWCYLDSAIRHYLKWRRGDNDEMHDRAFCWNVMSAVWTIKNKPEMLDV